MTQKEFLKRNKNILVIDFVDAVQMFLNRAAIVMSEIKISHHTYQLTYLPWTEKDKYKEICSFYSSFRFPDFVQERKSFVC